MPRAGGPAIHTVFVRNSKTKQSAPVKTQGHGYFSSVMGQLASPERERDEDVEESPIMPPIESPVGENDGLPIYDVFVAGGKKAGKRLLKEALLKTASAANRLRHNRTQTDYIVHSETDKTGKNIYFKLKDLPKRQNIEDMNLEEDMYLLIYSVSDSPSMDFAQMFLEEIRRKNKSAVVILVANKMDSVANERIVSVSDAKSLASSHCCKFIEVSAKSGENVEGLLFGIGRQLRLEISEKSRSPLSRLWSSVFKRQSKSRGHCDDLNSK